MNSVIFIFGLLIRCIQGGFMCGLPSMLSAEFRDASFNFELVVELEVQLNLNSKLCSILSSICITP